MVGASWRGTPAAFSSSREKPRPSRFFMLYLTVWPTTTGRSAPATGRGKTRAALAARAAGVGKRALRPSGSAASAPAVGPSWEGQGNPAPRSEAQTARGTRPPKRQTYRARRLRGPGPHDAHRTALRASGQRERRTVPPPDLPGWLVELRERRAGRALGTAGSPGDPRGPLASRVVAGDERPGPCSLRS